MKRKLTTLINYCFILIAFLISFKSYSQCTTNTSLYPAATFTPNCNGTAQNITTLGYATEYSMVYVTAGTTYTFSSSIGTDYLTIANAGGGAPVYAFGTTPVVWVATITGNVRFYNNTNSSCGTNTTSRTRSVRCGTPPAAPANNECAGAYSLTINAGNTCTSQTGGTLNGATASAQTTTCNATYDDDDVWYSFVATGTSHDLTISNVAGNNTDLYHAVFAGPCGSLSNPLTCQDANSSSLTGLTIGTTYFVRIYTWGTTTGANTTFSVCVTTPVNPCSSLTNIASCGSTINATIASGTGSFGGTSSCGFTTSGRELIYTFTPATTGSYGIQQFSSFAFIDYQYKAVSAGCSSTGWTCIDDISGAGSSPLVTLTAGVQYYILLDPESTAGGNISFAITCPPVNPCTTTTNVASCGTTINTTIAPGTGSYGTSACGFTTGGVEKIYTFTPATTGNYLIQQFSSFAFIDYQFKAVSAGCSSTGWTCVDDISGAGTSAGAMALTAGVQYYILLDPESTAGGNVSFSILCPPTPPANDNCPGAYTITPNSGTSCTSLANGTIYGASATSFTNGCGGTADDDVWYSFVAGSTTHSISITNISGSTTDLYHSVYAGSCASLGSPIVCSDPNTSGVSGLTPGNTYFVRIYSWTSTAGQTSSFSVCVTTPPPTGPCGNAANNDFCSNPATLTQGAGTFSSTTSGTYTGDLPGNVGSVFCGSIENNSWYAFVASATSATFPITSITGCSNGWGVQAQVYSVTTTTNNCCTAFTSVSNCYNPGTTTPGTVTATGLTIGNTYILMFDGNAGDVCAFTVSNWTAVGILPMELLTFTGHNEEEKNKIQWVTATEKNSQYFTVEKSKDGMAFEKMLDVTAAGFSTSPKNYNAFDMTPYKEITYYRLKLVDTDNSFEYSNIIAINNKNLTDYISNARPNPTNSELEFDVNTNSKEKILIEIYSNTGKLVMSEEKVLESGYRSLNLDLNKYDSGIYLLKVSFENSGKTEIQKIIKN